MREEIGSAKDQTGISARRFEKWITLKFFLILKDRFDKSGVGISHQGSSGRPESELSDSSDDCRSDVSDCMEVCSQHLSKTHFLFFKTSMIRT